MIPLCCEKHPIHEQYSNQTKMNMFWQTKQARSWDNIEVNNRNLQMERNAYWKHWDGTYTQGSNFCQFAFLTGHSGWNWSKAQKCQPIPLEHQKTTWSSSLLTVTHSLCTGWTNWRDHTWNFKLLCLHRWWKKRAEKGVFFFYVVMVMKVWGN